MWNEAVAALAHYPLRAHIDSCPCCRGPRETRHLHTKPLKDLTPDDLGPYVFRAMTTVGGVDDFRHFLPRILELLPDGFPVDREVVLSKLTYARWSQWPEPERSSVQVYYRRELWAWARRQPPDPDPWVEAPIGSWLCAIARTESDIRGYLADWESDRNAAAADNISRFLEDYRVEFQDGGELSAYWEDSPEQWTQVAEWAELLSGM